MPCDTQRSRSRPRSTITERKAEIKAVVSALDKEIAAGRVRARVDRRTGAITFTNWTAGQDARVSDACAYRRIMVEGSAMARQAIAMAERMAGRMVDKQALAQGIHSHDGGKTWGVD